MTTLRRTSGWLVALSVVAAVLAGCSGGDESGPGDHDRADVTFASAMVPHHDQALAMVAMTRGRPLSPEFARLTEHIRSAQAPEIREMRGWLDHWGEDDRGSRSRMDGGMMGGGSSMMAQRSWSSWMRGSAMLGARSFEAHWLRMMIAHHEGAVQMSRDEILRGTYRPALDLAASIVDSQSREIEQMRAMLAS
jgi:uncharacterized protein (DUF305 family)